MSLPTQYAALAALIVVIVVVALWLLGPMVRIVYS